MGLIKGFIALVAWSGALLLLMVMCGVLWMFHLMDSDKEFNYKGYFSCDKRAQNKTAIEQMEFDAINYHEFMLRELHDRKMAGENYGPPPHMSSEQAVKYREWNSQSESLYPVSLYPEYLEFYKNRN